MSLLSGKKMKLKKVNYSKLNRKAQETYNFQKLSGILVDYGYATNWLNVDLKGADFIAVHFNGIDILKIQLKSRITIDKKYLKKNIHITFPYKGIFFLVPHDKLVTIIKNTTGWQKSTSWIKNGGYSSKSIPENLLIALIKYKL